MTHPNDTPKDATLYAYLLRVKQYEHSIYIRSQQSGHWESISLAEATPEVWAEHVARWLESGHWPVRVPEPDEIKEEP